MWKLHVSEFRGALHSLNIPIEEPPAIVYENQDTHAFLRLPLHDSAAVASPHANKVYGEIFLRAILADRGVSQIANDEAKLIPWLNDPARLIEWRTTLGFSQANMRKPDAPDLFHKALLDAPDNAKLKRFDINLRHIRQP